MLVLSFGGSLGAKPLNEAMLPILLRHAEDGSCYHIHSVGTNGGEYLEKFARRALPMAAKARWKCASILTIWMYVWRRRIW